MCNDWLGWTSLHLWYVQGYDLEEKERGSEWGTRMRENGGKCNQERGSTKGSHRLKIRHRRAAASWWVGRKWSEGGTIQTLNYPVHDVSLVEFASVTLRIPNTVFDFNWNHNHQRPKPFHSLPRCLFTATLPLVEMNWIQLSCKEE